MDMNNLDDVKAFARLQIRREREAVIRAGQAEADNIALRAIMEEALRYILHVGANQTEKGLPHPQERLVKMMEEVLA